MNSIATFQIGKNGITEGTKQALNTLLDHHKHIRISVLKASGRDKHSIHTMAEQLTTGLKYPCEYKVIGFTIALRKHVKPIKEKKSVKKAL